MPWGEPVLNGFLPRLPEAARPHGCPIETHGALIVRDPPLTVGNWQGDVTIGHRDNLRQKSRLGLACSR
jgi:hypothetical protein